MTADLRNTADSTSMLRETKVRVEELESRLEFQDELIARLNDELVVHQQRIIVLEKNLALIAQRLRAGPDELPDADPRSEPPPPHY